VNHNKVQQDLRVLDTGTLETF